ncbi:MAG: type II CRISPR-associated endonuclease Cas1 [Candidatus Colwellbacteria bacterium]|jgi:CRISPR-associated protein Cas1|nr:type II CRISPR-associated endonuclease Cas1 [Candidatus Colwellbacteria bacterium]MCK9497609.1 type II CRISPR-associated endonuclease Cas1 [Candidatus Colwellbacteria bacterium]
MSWRIVNISNPARLSTRNDQLNIEQEEKCNIPLEDIGVILLENRAISLSSAFLSKCAEHKISVLTCNEKHLPNGVLLGYQNHSRQNKIINHQLSWTEPFKKRLWQSIIRQKIKNQAEALSQITGNETEVCKLLAYEKSVNSGDTTGREAVAARLYFSNIFPLYTTRETDNIINASLNYAYAIIRGVIARNLASYGFLTSIGINHTSELNQFNLADDLIEPIRPIADLYVFKKIIPVNKTGDLESSDKNNILKLLTEKIFIGDKNQSVMRSIEIMAQSLSSATDKNDYNLLLLPEINKKYG